MNAEDFMDATGYEPQDDDLSRANCPYAGRMGHTACGVCKHGKPVFMCEPCFYATADAPIMAEH